MTRVIGPPRSKRRHWTFLVCIAFAVGVGMIFVGGALGTAPQTAGFFELDKDANNNLTTQHVGVNQSQILANASSIAVCELQPFATTPVPNNSTILVDGEYMTVTGHANTVSTSTGGCSFLNPLDTAVDVRSYTVTRGVSAPSGFPAGTAAAKHPGDSDITLITIGSVAGNDWDQVKAAVDAHGSDTNPCAALAGSVACDFVTDPPGVTIFTGGSSDIADINTWTCTNQSVPDADEILDAYAIKYSNSTQDLYFGADRYATNGSKDFGFWFFKNAISSSGTTVSNTCPNGAFSGGLHSVGDILLLGTFTQGGAVSTIRAFKWVASGGDVATHLLSEGTFGDCVPGSDPSSGCSTVNNTTIPSPWTYSGKGAVAPSVIYAGGFLEGGIDLGALNLQGCFSSFMAETRSSPSLTAELKDFTIGKFESCGSNLTTTPKAADGTTNLSADSNNNNLVETSIGTGSVQVKDSALLNVNGTTTFTGTLSFHICGPIATGTCSTGGVDATPASGLNPVTANGTYTSAAVTLTSVGRYCWRSDFTSGTSGVPNASDSTAESTGKTGECFEVLPVTPSLTTVAVDCTTHAALSAAVPFGNPVCDKGILGSTVSTATQPGTNGGDGAGHYLSINATNGAAAGGKITFTLKGPDTTGPPFVCSTTNAGQLANTTGSNPEDNTTISGNGNYFTSGFTPSQAGPYHWTAQYTPASGDVNNSQTSVYNTTCGDSAEAVTVQQIPTTISTTQKVIPQDSATITSSVTGDLLPAGGTVTFDLYGGDTAANNLTNCQAHGTTGRIDHETFSTASTPAHTETFNTANTASVNANTTVYWRVTYATGDQAHTGRQSDCAESTATTFVNDAGDGTLFP